MRDLQEKYKTMVGLILIVASIALSMWLCLWVMVYGGLMQAVENFGENNSAVVWGIMRVIFAGLAVIPGYFGIVIGMLLLQD